jgi:hypothetical protein
MIIAYVECPIKGAFGLRAKFYWDMTIHEFMDKFICVFFWLANEMSFLSICSDG